MVSIFHGSLPITVFYIIVIVLVIFFMYKWKVVGFMGAPKHNITPSTWLRRNPPESRYFPHFLV